MVRWRQNTKISYVEISWQLLLQIYLRGKILKWKKRTLCHSWVTHKSTKGSVIIYGIGERAASEILICYKSRKSLYLGKRIFTYPFILPMDLENIDDPWVKSYKTSRYDGSISSHGELSDQSLAVRLVYLSNIFDALFARNEM